EALLADRDPDTPFTRSSGRDGLVRNLVDEVHEWNKKAKSDLATAVSRNEQAGFTRQLLLDVSEIRNNDAGTGVQRVVRSYLRALLQSPPEGFQVVPVYATREEGYRYAWRLAQRYGATLPHGLCQLA